MRITETFVVAASPEAVFDYMTNPANLAQWQTTKTSVEQLTDGPPGLGTRVRERTKPPVGKEFEQVVEFTEFDRPSRFHVHVVEGPHLIDGTWTLTADRGGTSVTFVAEGEMGGLLRFGEPLVRRAMARQFAGYHRNVQRNVASG
jgi:uncharacterized protein YndB with AHSA1/START domain